MGLRNALIVGGIVVLLGGSAAFYHQNGVMKRLVKENAEQKVLIKEQQIANQQLSTHLEQEQQAVRNQQEITNQLRKQVETTRESIKTILVKEPCGRVPMPRAVIERLQQSTH